MPSKSSDNSTIDCIDCVSECLVACVEGKPYGICNDGGEDNCSICDPATQFDN
tara:strand:+ start:383 stop:541 length:159 start_codon:yes stop_codon:yes gene_type:complete